jgi:DNA integrity scanning protein DisA with diadenylate cyclase activity
MLTKIQIKRPGEPLPKVEKRAIETLNYVLDCSQILEEKELIRNISRIVARDVIVQNPVVKLGKNIEVQFPEMTVGTASQLDSIVQVIFDTSLGNTRAAVFQLTVYRQ